MVIPGEVRIKHDAKIFELVNPAEGVPIGRNAKTVNLGKPLMIACEYGLGLSVV